MPPTALNEGMASFIRHVPQIVPESWCMKCQICCRFPDTEGVQTPTWSSAEADLLNGIKDTEGWLHGKSGSPSLFPILKSCGNGYRCPAFVEETNQCSIYSIRPLDCRLYPFGITQDASGTRVTLTMDAKCPYIQAHGADPEVSDYAQSIAQYLESPLGLEYIKQNPQIIGSPWPEFIHAASLPKMMASAQSVSQPPHPSLKPLLLSDLPQLKDALARRSHASSSYTTAGILGWSDLIHYWWATIQGTFSLFAEQAGGIFMPLPPLSESPQREILDAAWEILTEANKGSLVSRIGGIEPADHSQLMEWGFKLIDGEAEYLYKQNDLETLRGNRYRSQRWAINRCHREGPFLIRPYRKEDLVPSLWLYTQWAIERQQSVSDSFPKSLVRDGLFFHRRLMMNHEEFGLVGRVIEAEGKIKAYTFGAPVSSETFCIFLEIADRTIPGLAQFIFREFCRELKDYPVINAMGDSDLANLRRAKLAYRPIGFTSTVSIVGKENEGKKNSWS